MDKCISREKAIETIQYRVCQGHGNKEHICKRCSCAYCGIMEVISDISSIEAANVQPVKHGRWLHDRRTQWKCSECGNFLDFDGLNCGRGSAFYCPNCGARMDGDTNG